MKIRKGMWVMYDGRIGIAASVFDNGGAAEVHLVDDKGLTRMVIPAVDTAALRQAKLSEIPEARRPNPKKLSMSLGYKD